MPVDILLSQKIFAALARPRPVGRDFFDIVFLFGKTAPNYQYLQAKVGIKNTVELKAKLLERCQGLDFKQLGRDVEPFLFSPSDVKKVLLFKDFVESFPDE